MSWSEPVYDRTQADITNKMSKAFFNVLDWTRINGNANLVKVIIETLNNVQIDFYALDEPTITTIPSVEEIDLFLSNLETLRENSGLSSTSGLVAIKTDFLPGPGANSPDYNDVNDWERNLYILRDLLYSAAYYRVPCGISESGQIRFWQSRFRDPFIKPAASPVRRPRAGIAILGASETRKNKFRRYP